jgi:magnesium transporter
VPIARIALAEAARPLKELVSEPLITVQAQADVGTVVDLIHKYNLSALPVIDEEGHLLGIVTADDVLELVINKK